MLKFHCTGDSVQPRRLELYRFVAVRAVGGENGAGSSWICGDQENSALNLRTKLRKT